jgi:hypothetical protein
MILSTPSPSSSGKARTPKPYQPAPKPNADPLTRINIPFGPSMPSPMGGPYQPYGNEWPNYDPRFPTR